MANIIKGDMTITFTEDSKPISVVEKLTEKEAKAITLEVWRYLRDHPEIDSKVFLPSKLFSKIENLRNECPLCELFLESEELINPGCESCPLAEAGHKCQDAGENAYEKWAFHSNSKRRKEAAATIVEIVERWEV